MNFFHLIFPCANIFFGLHPPPSSISFLMVRLSTIISRGRVGNEMASGEMKIPQMESLLAGYEARRTEVAIMRGSVWPVATPPGSSHWGFAIAVHSPPSCTQKETILRPRAPDRPHIRFLRVHPFECYNDFRTMAKRDVFRTFIKVSRVHWERDNTWWLNHEQYIRKREGR